tara:strand:+ start:99 stop:692 length:594 start_codon:yes stop_codon:yes gene_type:complete
MGIIFAFGDSITLGKGKLTSWSELLKKKYGRGGQSNIVYNLGICAENSRGLSDRIEFELKSRLKNTKESNVIIFISVGMNDLKALNDPKNYQISPKDFKKNLKEIIKIAKKFSDIIYLIDINKVDEDLSAPFMNIYFTNEGVERYNKLIYEVSKDSSIPAIKTNFGKYYKSLLFDGVHPNKEGYKMIFDKIWKRVNT